MKVDFKVVILNYNIKLKNHLQDVTHPFLELKNKKEEKVWTAFKNKENAINLFDDSAFFVICKSHAVW